MERNEYLQSARSFVMTMNSLSDVLETEVGDLYTASPKVLEQHYNSKSRLLADYAAQLTTLREADRAMPTELPADISAALKESANRLTLSMDKNIKALAVAKAAGERVIDIIIEAVKQQRHTGAAYGVGNNGNMIAAPSPDGSAQAVTLDTRL